MSSDLFIKFKVLSFIKSPFLRTSIPCLRENEGECVLFVGNFRDNFGFSGKNDF